MNSKYKHCPYCGEEILAVAKKCRYCGEWLDKTDMSDTPQQTESEEKEDYSEEEMDEKPSFIRRTWKVILPVLVIILLVVGKIGLKEFGKNAVKEAVKEHSSISESEDTTDSDEATYVFQYIGNGEHYDMYLTDGKENVYEYDDEASYEDFVLPAITSRKLYNELSSAEEFNKLAKSIMALPVSEKLVCEGLNITDIVNKEYYDFNPFQVELIEKGYGYQTYYIAKSEYDERYIRFSRGENNGVKVEVQIYKLQ